MERLSTTPFGARPVSAGLLATRALAEAEAPVAKFDKWELFRDLCTARKVFGVSDRDLSVLNALLTFHPQRALEDGQPLIVFPSNVSLSERAHGMAESTLRRHLAALVGAGLITRHDSPNGKRYASRDATGALVRAFGFDLRPLLVRAVEISEAAEEARQQTARIRRVREEITLLLRDALKLIAYGQEAMPGSAWDALEERALDARRVQRRQLDLADLEDLHGLLDALLREIECVLSDGLPT
ncbi:MAG: plasmid replication protein RepC, partial [Pseudomonadota bacterium]